MNDKYFDLDFGYAYGTPGFQANFRQHPEDFQVTEILRPEFCGEGEHLYLWIEKTGENTQWVAKQLAHYYSVPEVAIGFCGMKDRHAITRQWFSVHLPGHTVSQLPMLPGNIQVLEHHRHAKKLRRGDHQGNRFMIRLRNVNAVDCSQQCAKNGSGIDDIREDLDKKLATVKRCGVPNYFGEQRFGIDGNNLLEADKLLKPIIERQLNSSPNKETAKNKSQKHRRGRKRKQRSPVAGIYLSAARSYLFNQVLSQRLKTETWPCLISLGDAFKTGPLWGRGRSQVPEPLRDTEQQILTHWQDWLAALEFTGLSQERRALQLVPQQFEVQWQQQDLVISFNLEPGQYATAVLREIAVLNSP